MMLLRFIWGHLGSDRWRFGLAIAANVAEGLLCALPALAAAMALLALMNGAQAAELWPWCLAFPLAVAGRAVAARISWTQGSRAGNGAVERIRLRLLEHMRRIPMGTLALWPPSRLAMLVAEDGRWVMEAGTFTLNRVVTGLTAATAFIGLAIWFAPAVGGVVLGVAIVAALLTPLLGKLLGFATAERSLRLTSLAQRIAEYADGIAVFRSFGRSGVAFAEFAKAVAGLRALMLSVTVRFAPLHELSSAVFSLAAPAAIALAAYAWLPGSERAPERLLPALLLALAAREIIVHQVLNQLLVLRLGQHASRRMAEFLAEPVQGGTEPLGFEPPAIETIGLRFAYAGGAREALAGVDFKAAAGRVTAIVGPSGSGKTTLAASLMRFIDPTAGSVRIDGRDASGMSPAEIMRRVSLVGQDVRVFKDTVRANLMIGDPSADQERLLAAIMAARFDEVIAGLPLGLETPVGDGGKTLSGGERQRLALARAFLKDAPILILDEATSSLDPANEAAIRDAIQQLSKGKTVIVIAHRLAAIKDADRIHVLADGRIVESGRHDDLLAAAGLYARLWTIQERAGGWRICGSAAAERG
jgi:ATP-binding cassette subfamily B protein